MIVVGTESRGCRERFWYGFVLRSGCDGREVGSLVFLGGLRSCG